MLFYMYKPRTTQQEYEAHKRRLVDQFVFQLAQLWVVARCKCPLVKWHSLNHLDCFSVDPWLVDEIRLCTEGLIDEMDGRTKVVMRQRERVRWRTDIARRLSRCSESNDSLNLEPDSLCNSARRQ
ncbi:unnamed protein product [Bursaphelenchus okinawaensis]|uniref:Uncharacterized protein n=1 Tax=Bursaphelenchus okinawaensis TaxID=465554 RepID=A0A811KJQ4_9BILA|nr:unnamed protein product [Bursaphelenchus okinawaensis]CAG9106186.1 unnamed protein product [Bursaphelenchus okinawaensis]